MFVNQAEKSLAILMALGSFLITITVNSWNVNEPVNAPKLFVLGALAGGSLFFAVQNKDKFADFSKLKFLKVIAAVFLVSALLSIFFSESSIINGFYGTYGRNTGFLTYLCLVILLLISTLLRSASANAIVINGLFFAGVVNLVYFIFTRFGIELISWSNGFGRILGTFGNPNFVGAFMGIFVVLCSVRLVDKGTSVKWKIPLIVLILIAIYEVKLSLAIQGIVIICLGWSIIGFFYIRSKFESKIFLIGYATLLVVIGAFAIAGALQKGPLASLIYKTSVSLRGEYWYAGWQMGITHPFFGVGMDSYGIWYRRMRDTSALTLPGPETTSDAAHNIFLDIFAYGGFPLFIAYALLISYVLLHIWKGFSLFKKFDPVYVSLIAIWICYQTQAIISINQIGLAIWGWIPGGLIIGYVRAHIRGESEISAIPQSSSNAKGRNAVKKAQPVSFWLMLLGIFVGGAVSAPPVIADSKWYASQVNLDPATIASDSKVWPLEAIRLMQASYLYTKNNVPTTGLELARFTVEKFPNNFYAWRLLSNTPGLTETEKAKAKAEMRRLDPLNPEFK
jgi:O-antigen ligase